MKTKIKLKKILLTFGMLSVLATTSAVMTSCAVVDSVNKFRIVNLNDVDNSTPYNELKTVNHTVKNIIYGTTAINNGNYVMAVSTNSDLNQYEFLHGSKRPSTENNLWKGEWGTAIRSLDGKIDKQIYPNGIEFLLFNDDFIDQNSWNPFAVYPDRKDEIGATQEDKDNSGKLRREDESAKQYRDIVNFLISTYEAESIPNSWKIIGNEGSRDPGKEITKIMIIAFKNVNGTIERNFYGGSSSGDNEGDSNGDGGNSDGNTDGNGDNPSESTRISVRTDFQKFLFDFYANNN